VCSSDLLEHHPSKAFWACNFAVENEADVMSYFDHCIPPELTEIVVDHTNLYAQQIAKMPCPITK
jgi:hypothetical protein